MSAIEFLERAADLMLERADDPNGDGEAPSMGRVLAAFNAITGRDLSDRDGWLFMCLMKMVEQSQSVAWDRTQGDYLIAYTALMAQSWDRPDDVEVTFDADFDTDED